MTRDEATNIYAEIGDLSTNEINSIIARELRRNNVLRSVIGTAAAISGGIVGNIGGVAGAALNVPSPESNIVKSQEELEVICKEAITKNKKSIKEILKSHPKSTNYVIDIIMLMVPAITQQYLGISAMAIVGSIVILCRQGLTSYLQ